MADYGITREQALELVKDWTKNQNLIKHMLAVEAEMRALAKHFDADPDLWGLAGLLHDADYEMFQDEPEKHPSKIFAELEKRGVDKRIIEAIRAHAWQWSDRSDEPENKMEWSLYTCDELSGLIIAVALVRPDKKLSSTSTESVLKKWDSNSFASGVHREQIELCEEKLNIPLKEFIEINLQALQGISGKLGL